MTVISSARNYQRHVAQLSTVEQPREARCAALRMVDFVCFPRTAVVCCSDVPNSLISQHRADRRRHAATGETETNQCLSSTRMSSLHDSIPRYLSGKNSSKILKPTLVYIYIACKNRTRSTSRLINGTDRAWHAKCGTVLNIRQNVDRRRSYNSCGS